MDIEESIEYRKVQGIVGEQSQRCFTKEVCSRPRNRKGRFCKSASERRQDNHRKSSGELVKWKLLTTTIRIVHSRNLAKTDVVSLSGGTQFKMHFLKLIQNAAIYARTGIQNMSSI